MSRIVYLNGQFVPEAQATINIMDRGFLFADGVYEVSAVLHGKLVDNAAHLARLEKSLRALSIPLPIPTAEIEAAMLELIARNHLQEGAIYLQITRGVAERDFLPPAQPLTPTLFMVTQKKNILQNPMHKTGITVATVPDIRWTRRDIKSIALLPQVLAKMQARERGAQDAWMVDAEGYITEAASANAYIVKDGVIITRALSESILHGVTRAAILKLAAQEGLRIEERLFTVEEAYAADEAFLTSATTLVYGVVKLDDTVIGDGNVGGVTKALLEGYLNQAMG